MIKYHKLQNDTIAAEIPRNSVFITRPGEMLDLIAEAGYQNSTAIILYKETLHSDFFDLRTGLAGEILQKFSNYRLKLSIIGEFSGHNSSSLNDFIRESNRTGIICFVSTIDEAFSKLIK